MFDIGWQEFLLITVIAVVVVGPKDLPRVVRSGMEYVRKARAMAYEFRSGLEDVAREAELDDIRKQAEALTKGDVAKSIGDAVDPDGSLKKSFDEAREASGAEETEAEMRRIADSTRSYANSADIPPETGPITEDATAGDAPDEAVATDGEGGARIVEATASEHAAAAEDVFPPAPGRASSPGQDAGPGKVVRTSRTRGVRAEPPTPSEA